MSTYDPDAGQVCLCVSEHRPGPMELDAHHVWPSAMGGPDVEANRVWLDPMAHVNTHVLLRQMVKVGRELTYHECQDFFDDPVNHYCHKLALLGYQRSVRGTL